VTLLRRLQQTRTWHFGSGLAPAISWFRLFFGELYDSTRARHYLAGRNINITVAIQWRFWKNEHTSPSQCATLSTEDHRACFFSVSIRPIKESLQQLVQRPPAAGPSTARLCTREGCLLLYSSCITFVCSVSVRGSKR
jgi:hypothetical protein